MTEISSRTSESSSPGISSEFDSDVTTTSTIESLTGASLIDTINESAEDIAEAQNQRKRNAPRITFKDSLKHSTPKPTLLTPDLIDKLMASESVVKLLTKQLDRSMNLKDASDQKKRLIARQVFEDMRQRSVKMNSSNIQAAVERVASSYEKASKVEERNKRKSRADPQPKPKSLKIDTKGFGLRSSAVKPDKKEAPKSPTIDSSLSQSEASKKSKDIRKGRDSNSNPIVVVVLPNGKA